MGAFFKELLKAVVVTAITYTAKEMIDSLNGKEKS